MATTDGINVLTSYFKLLGHTLVYLVLIFSLYIEACVWCIQVINVLSTRLRIETSL